ncbi:uncharacterized protein V6R79_001963 [Siganus canaliculatus]
MTLPSLLWTLLAASLWASGLGQFIEEETAITLYPKILDTATIECDCAKISCDSVYWFRSISGHSKLQYIGRCNNAGRPTYRDNKDEERFKFHRKSGTSFTLRILNVTEEDTGIYSCVLTDLSKKEMWKPGVLLLPGVTPTTVAPTTKPKPPVKTVCGCTKKKSSKDGCGSLILWPLVGLNSALAVALLCTLYYFSRLPKKCRHHFVKRR